MCGAWEPNGADSATDNDYTLSPFRVELREEEGPSWFVTVHALGKHDARNLARELARDRGSDSPAVIRVVAV